VVANADSPGEKGNRLGETPEHNFAIWQKYTFSDGALDGFFFGAGVNARSEASISPLPVDQTFEYPAYTAVDLVVGYKSKGEKPWEITARLNNATDEFYFSRNKFYANGRNIQVTAKVRF